MLSDSAKTVLEKARKNKPRVQKSTGSGAATGVKVAGVVDRVKTQFSRVLRPFKGKKDYKDADQTSLSSN